MAWCPHCNTRYDEHNETQPCCGACGHPISCGCSGHSWSRPTTRPPVPGIGGPSSPERSNGHSGRDETGGGDGDDNPYDFDVDDDPPF
jgi:hypothetical protein